VLAATLAAGRVSFAQPSGAQTSAGGGAGPGAAAGSTAQSDAAKTAKARALFEAGGRAYDNAQYDVALQAFTQAYALFPKDGILFSIAQTERRLFTTTGDSRHRDEAVRSYRAYLDKVKTGGRRGDAAKALEDLSAGMAPSPSNGGATPPPVTVDTAPKATRFYISSTTPGVRVSVDGKPETAANVTAEVTPGDHKIRFAAPGFREKEVTVQALPEELVPVTFDLEELPGTIRLSTVSGAEINVDGRYVGDAPLTAPLALPSGKHFVVASKDGHVTRSEVVDLSRGKPTPLDLDLPTTTQRDVSYGVFAVSGAALVTSGVFVGLAFWKQGAAQSILDKKTTGNISGDDITEYNDARAARDRFTIAAAATGGGAGLLAIIGLGMFLIDPADKATAAPALDETSPGTPKPAAPTPSLELDDATASIGPDGVMANVKLRF